MTEEPPQVVSYPIAGQLDKIDVKLDRIDAKLDTKADRAELLRVEEKMARHDDRITVLETGRAADDASGATGRRRAESRRASWALVVSAVAALATVGAVLVTFLTAHH